MVVNTPSLAGQAGDMTWKWFGGLFRRYEVTVIFGKQIKGAPFHPRSSLLATRWFFHGASISCGREQGNSRDKDNIDCTVFETAINANDQGDVLGGPTSQGLSGRSMFNSSSAVSSQVNVVRATIREATDSKYLLFSTGYSSLYHTLASLATKYYAHGKWRQSTVARDLPWIPRRHAYAEQINPTYAPRTLDTYLPAGPALSGGE